MTTQISFTADEAYIGLTEKVLHIVAQESQ